MVINANTQRGKVMTDNNSVLTAVEAAEFLRAHVETLRRLARRREIPAYKVGTDWRFPKEALLHWIETHHLRARKSRILVVDDEAVVRVTIREVLERHGYEVVMAEDGQTALGLIEQKTPDLVLLDMKMPGMDGPAILAEIRNKHDALPVIIITGNTEGELVCRALQYGPLMVLPKPFHGQQLLDGVRGTLNGSQQERVPVNV